MGNNTWFDERERGTYIQSFKKEINDIEYIKKESTMVNSKNEIINFVREYSPSIPFGLENDGWEEIIENEINNDFER